MQDILPEGPNQDGNVAPTLFLSQSCFVSKIHKSFLRNNSIDALFPPVKRLNHRFFLWPRGQCHFSDKVAETKTVYGAVSYHAAIPLLFTWQLSHKRLLSPGPLDLHEPQSTHYSLSSLVYDMVPSSLPQLHLVSMNDLPPNTSCAICINKVHEFAVRLICGHAIDANCINQWLTAGDHRTCPRCNYPLQEKDIDEPVDSAFGGSRSPSDSCVEARSTKFGNQLNPDGVLQSNRPYDADLFPPPNSSQGAGNVYLPYRPPHPIPPSSDYHRAPSQSPQDPLPNRRYDHQPYSPSPYAEARAVNKGPNTPFIPAEFGLPPPMVRPSFATQASASRNDRSILPASLLAGGGGNIQTMTQSDRSTNLSDCAEANSPASSRTSRLNYRPSNYIPYRFGSYSSTNSSDVGSDI